MPSSDQDRRLRAELAEGLGYFPASLAAEDVARYRDQRTYDEALWPTDPWYDPARDPVSHMLEIRGVQRNVTTCEQLTLEVRRDCDLEYLRRTEAFIRRASAGDTPFYVYFNHSLLQASCPPNRLGASCL